MLAAALPALISAGSSLLGGLFGKSSKDADRAAAERQAAADRATAAANRAEDIKFRDQQWASQQEQLRIQQENILRSEAAQREFAQSGIQWRAADAKAAGLHPLAALGGSGAAFSPSAPVSIGGVSGVSSSIPSSSIPASGSIGASVASMGQDISRAINATRTNGAREEAFMNTVNEMQLQNMALKNDLLASQIQRLKVNQNPAFPETDGPMHDAQRVVLQPSKLAPTTSLAVNNTRIRQDSGISDAQEFEQRYGETLSDWVFGPYIAWRDFNVHVLEPASRRFEQRRERWHSQERR